LLRNGALKQVRDLIKNAQAAGSVRLFSVRHEFPTEWTKFLNREKTDRYELSLELRPEHYPFWSQTLLNAVERVGIIARYAKEQVPDKINLWDKNDQNADNDILQKDPALGNLFVGKMTQPPAKPNGELKLYFDGNALSDLWIAVTWKG
jgi:hypothetical protein